MNRREFFKYLPCLAAPALVRKKRDKVKLQKVSPREWQEAVKCNGKPWERSEFSVTKTHDGQTYYFQSRVTYDGSIAEWDEANISKET